MQGPRQCKFGSSCRNLANGNCRFYHPPGEESSYNPQPDNSRPPFGGNRPPRRQDFQGTGGHQGQGGYQGPGGHQGNHSQGGYQGGGQGGQGYQGGQGGGQGGYSGGRPGGQPQRGDDPMQHQLCKMFQLGLECKFGEKCNRKHAFIPGEENALVRFMQMRNVPVHPVSKLTRFSSGGKEYFGMRNNLDVNFFEFNMQSRQLTDVFQWALPDPNGKFTYYDQKDDCIFYARQNPDLPYQDLGYYNLTTLKQAAVQGAHSDKITGVARLQENVFLSSSMNGELKVWFEEGGALKIHQEATDRLKSAYNPQNAKLEVYFVDVSEIQGTKIVAAGTSDGRLLFFLGGSLEFKQVAFGEQYVTHWLN
jgi:hypothetical protein